MRWLLAALAIVLVCSALLILLAGWWALLAIPVYLISVAVLTQVGAGGTQPMAVRLLVAVGLPTLSMLIIVGAFRLFGWL